MKYNAPYGSTDPDAPYVDRNSPGAVKGSAVPGPAIEDPQRELVNLIVAAGIPPDEDDLAQVAKAIQSGRINYAVAGGAANALTATFTPVPATLPDGMTVTLLISATNTGAATLNGDALLNNNGGAFGGGELVAGNLAQLIRRGGAWRLNGISRGRLLATRVFKTPGTFTYTPTSGTLYVEVEVQAAGGGGGGCPATAAAQVSGAGNGGSGAYARKVITSSFAGVTITVGAAGAGVLGGSGVNGGASSFGALVSANGGNGGGTGGPTGSGVQFQAAGGSGGVAGVSGDLNIAGIKGGETFVINAQGFTPPLSPAMFSGGFGFGGVGDASPPSTGAKSGSPGGAGIVIVREYA